MLVEPGVLRKGADPGADSDAVVDDVQTKDLAAAAGGFEQAQQQLDRSGFAGTVGPQESEDRFLRDTQVERLKRIHLAKRLAQAFRRDDETIGIHAVFTSIKSAAI